jgi:hypothetical protein
MTEIIEPRRRTLREELARLWPPYRRRSDAAQREILRTSWDGYNEYRARRHEMMKRIAKQWERERAASHGPFSIDPEPPGTGWDTIIHHEQAFAASGLCELWCISFGYNAPRNPLVVGAAVPSPDASIADETQFYRYRDFPPDYNFSGMWWRPTGKP